MNKKPNIYICILEARFLPILRFKEHFRRISQKPVLWNTLYIVFVESFHGT